MNYCFGVGEEVVDVLNRGNADSQVGLKMMKRLMKLRRKGRKRGFYDHSDKAGTKSLKSCHPLFPAGSRRVNSNGIPYSRMLT